MKKLTTSIISLAMIFIFAGSAYSLINLNSTIFPKATAASIIYVVNIYVSSETSVCGDYIVMVTDGAGNLIAPPQPYIPGVVTYTFNEPGHDFAGTRTAKMTGAPFMAPVCRQQLNTPSQSVFTWYVTGETYPFSLYPKFEAQHE